MSKNGYTVREIINFTVPLIFNALVVNLMFTTDRVVLAHYSIDSMNAVALGGGFLALLSFFALCIAQISTVFVGQYNGKEEFSKVGRPVWQMIYFSLLFFSISFLVSFFIHKLHLFPLNLEKEGMSYLLPAVRCLGLSSLIAALNSFFIGRGKGAIVIAVTLVSNILNAILDVLMIFGYKGIIPEMGTVGAAYATILSQIWGVVVLFSIFVSKKNREKYNTTDFKFRYRLFIDCVKIGLPISCGRVLAMFGGFVLLEFYNRTSKDLATLENFAFTIWLISAFVADGCGKAISSMSANLIGRRDKESVEKLLLLFSKGLIIFSVVLSVPLIFFDEKILALADMINSDFIPLHEEMSFLLKSTWLIISFDGFLFVLCGLLNSGGDTKFPMLLEISAFWIGVVIPTAVLFYTGNLNSIRIVYTLIPIVNVFDIAVLYYRYRKGNWFKRLV